MVVQYRGEGKSYPKSRKSTPVYAGRNYAGGVAGNTFGKSADSKRHLILKPWRAWAFDRSVLQEATKLGATQAQVYDRATGNTYTATFETIYKHGYNVNRGHGDQIALALDHWSIDGAIPVAEQRAAQSNQERIDLQMTLFGEPV